MNSQSRLVKIFSSVSFWHILFWLLNLVLFIVSAISDHAKQGEITFSMLMPELVYFLFLVVIVYINHLVLIPRFAAKRKVAQYLLFLVISAIVVSFLFFITSSWMLKEDLSASYIVSFFFLEIVYIIITSFFKFFKDWIVNQGLRTKILEIEKQKVEAELDTLKSQLNPHFLFNVLNNIYSHSLLKTDIAPSIVLKLSDLMSYILYDSKTKVVPIQKEIEFVRNYIELEKIRIEKDIDVTFECENTDGVLIPPLLFFPLIENSFKHGIGSNPVKREVFLKLEMHGNELSFNIKNSKGNHQIMRQNKKRGGIGIKNVKKRLALLYPDTHVFDLIDKEGTFEVNVRIENINLMHYNGNKLSDSR